MLGILPDEAALVAAEEMVAANKTVKEAMADEQHIIDVEDSDSDNSDGASSDGFPEEEDPEEAAFQEINERDQAIMYQHTVDDAVFEAEEELLDDPVLCGVCEGGGHTDLLLLCDGQDLQKVGPRQGLKKRKPEQKCAVACHTFCCSPPLQSSWLTVAGPASSANTAAPPGQGSPFVVPQPTLSTALRCFVSPHRQEVPEGDWFCEACEALRLEGWQKPT